MKGGVRIFIRVVFLAERSVGTFDFSVRSLLVDSKKLELLEPGKLEQNRTLIPCRNPRRMQPAGACIAVSREQMGATLLRRGAPTEDKTSGEEFK